MAPAILGTWEIHPLGMSKLVAHEVQIAFACVTARWLGWCWVVGGWADLCWVFSVKSAKDRQILGDSGATLHIFFFENGMQWERLTCPTSEKGHLQFRPIQFQILAPDQQVPSWSRRLIGSPHFLWQIPKVFSINIGSTNDQASFYSGSPKCPPKVSSQRVFLRQMPKPSQNSKEKPSRFPVEDSRGFGYPVLSFKKITVV